MTARRLHRWLGFAVGLFIALHLANHLAGLAAQDVHGAVLQALRIVYRSGLVEPLLLAGLALQAVLGLRLALRKRRLTLQSLSGGYLALFLAIHVSVVLTARWQGTETDLAFAAAGLHAGAPWPVVFGLYYGLAVIAVFAHLSVPLGRRHPTGGRLMLGAGVLCAGLLVLLLAGVITPLAIPVPLIAAFP